MTMPDLMDAVQDRVLFDTEVAIAAARPMVTAGRAICECGEPISAERQRLGAVRCLDCQQQHEQRSCKVRRL